MKNNPRNIWLTIGVAALLAGLFIYWGGLSSPWLFDDHPNLTNNRALKIDGTVFEDWRSAAFSTNSGPTRRPVAMVTFADNYAASGSLDRAEIKAVNVLLHGAIAVFIFLLCREILASIGAEKHKTMIAVTAAAVWFLHDTLLVGRSPKRLCTRISG